MSFNNSYLLAVFSHVRTVAEMVTFALSPKLSDSLSMYADSNFTRQNLEKWNRTLQDYKGVLKRLERYN